MKLRILLAMFAVLTVVMTGCEALLPPMVFSTGETNPIPGCEILMPVVSGELDIYDSPSSNFPPYGLEQGFTYVFYPVEYTFVNNRYWVKVWVNIVTERSMENAAGSETERYRYEYGYRWLQLYIDFPPDQLPGCNSLPLTDGIDGLTCIVILPANATLPARVGPGFDRAISLYITSSDSSVYLRADGYQSIEGNVWLRILYEGRHLWINQENGRLPCSLPLVKVPPVIPVLQPTPVTSLSQQTEDFPVRHCHHIGGNRFQWVSTRVTYDHTGFPLREDVTGGPFQGEWREGCPAGEPTPGNAPPTLEPTSPPLFTPTPEFGE